MFQRIFFSIAVCTSLLTPFSLVATDEKVQSKTDPKETSIVHPLEGIWEQRFVIRGKWTGCLRAELTATDQSLSMNIVEQSDDSSLIHSQGITNVKHVLDTWSFDSDWGAYGKGNFVLKFQSDDRYVGHSYYRGRKNTTNEWVRVAKLVDRKRRLPNGQPVRVYESSDSWHVIGTINRPIYSSLKVKEVTRSSVKLGYRTSASSPNAGELAAQWVIPKKLVPSMNGMKIEIVAN